MIGAAAWPRMRQDLRIERAGPLASGAPGWVIVDPVRHRFFQIGRPVLEILDAWDAGSVAAVRKEVAARFGRQLSESEIDDVRKFLVGHELADGSTSGGRALAQKELARRRSWLAWVVHNYLFFKIPLVRPQRFLNATRTIGDILFSPVTLAIFGLLGALAIVLVARRWDTVVQTAMSFISGSGFLLYGVSLVLVKAAHELGHAYMATRFRVRVPTMGVAFMVLAPFLYSDVSDAWRLKSRHRRLAIGAAGMLAEAMVAVLAMLAWVFLPDGPARSIAFATATTSLIATLLLNLNPLMRFDGYHLLADAVGIPNLQDRANAIGKWRLREFLWGLKAPPPEPFPARSLRLLAVYAYAMWIYRFFLFLGIAVLVYQYAFKALGVVLFVIEIVWFILRPVANEVMAQWRGRSEILKRRRSIVTLLVAAAGIVYVFTPLASSVEIPAVSTPAQETALYPRSPGQIVSIERRQGDRVRAGEAILVLRSPDLTTDMERAELRLALLERRIARAAADAADRSELSVLLGQRASEQERLESLRRLIGELVLRAPQDGVLRDMDPDLREGMWVGMRAMLARIVDGPGAEARGYIEESDLRRIREGARGRFLPEDPQRASFPVQVTRIGRTAAETLDLLPLALPYDGSIPAVQDKAGLKPGVAVYPVTFSADPADPATTSFRGRVFAEGVAESLAERVFRRIVGVLVRESGA